MTHGEIDEMKAGAALDQLACEALGIESVPVVRWRCRICRSSGCSETVQHRDRFWEPAETGQRFYPAISTDRAAMVAAILRLAWCTLIPPSSSPHVRKYWYVELERNVGDGERYANGETAMEAFARATAKTKEVGDGEQN